METEEKAKSEIPFLFILPCDTVKNNHGANSTITCCSKSNISGVRKAQSLNLQTFVWYEGGKICINENTSQPL